MANRILLKAQPCERGTRSNKHIQTNSLNMREKRGGRWEWVLNHHRDLVAQHTVVIF